MRGGRFVFMAACAGMLLFGICLVTLGALAAGLKDKFQLDELTSGTLFSILPVGILSGSLLFGPLCDKYGYKFFLILSALCMFIGLQGIAWAGSFVVLEMSIFIFGLGGGAINGASNAVVSDISIENRGADLSLLGVSYAIGALGMPFVLGLLESRLSFEIIIAAVGLLALLAAFFFLGIRFPPPKQVKGIPFFQGLRLLKDKILVLIAFFLFCQSSFEGIIYNWTTTYLTDQKSIEQDKALYALSLYVVGMAFMRILIGTVLRAAAVRKILIISFGLLFSGCLLLTKAGSFPGSAAGLVLAGAGLAAGFPVMLGFVGDLYAKLSATAFSLVLVIALIGNMTVNLLMGFIAAKYGIQHLTTVAFFEIGIMTILSWQILKKLNTTK